MPFMVLHPAFFALFVFQAKFWPNFTQNILFWGLGRSARSAQEIQANKKLGQAWLLCGSSNTRMAEQEKTTTTTTSSDPKPEEVEDHEDGQHDLHVTPKKKKDKKKKNKEANPAAEAVTMGQIEAAMAQFGLHTATKPQKAEKTSHAFWDTQPVPKKGIHYLCTSEHE